MNERIGASNRLGDPVQKLRDPPRQNWLRVFHDIEGDQPRQDGGGNQQPDIKVENDKNDVENGTHGWAYSRGLVADFDFLLDIGSSPLQTRESSGQMPPKTVFFRRS